MLDIQYIHDNPEKVQEACRLKNKEVNVSEIVTLDEKRKELQFSLDQLKYQQKEAGKARDIEKAKSLKSEIQELQKQHDECVDVLNTELKKLPNMIHPDVPVGKDESENVVAKKVGEPTSFSFEPKDHQELGEALGYINKMKAAEVTGSRFYYLQGGFAELQNALVQFAFSVLLDETVLQKIIDDNNLSVSAKPFQLVNPPLMIHYETADKMGRLHPMDDRYCLDQDQFMLIGSAEHSLGPIHMNEVLPEEELPKRYVAFTPSFRREAGTYGKDTRGIFRNHQFDKIEMETFVGSEDGLAEQDFIIAIQEYLLQQLGLPYQKVNICTGDMGSMDYRQVDMECRMPGQQAYRETHTSDYMTDFQARRLNTQVQYADGTKEFAHMNDATAMAFPRLLIAVIENYHQEDGSITIPEVLVPFMRGKERIS